MRPTWRHVSLYGRLPDARFDLAYLAGQVAVLYPACLCRVYLLALMESADPRLIFFVGFAPEEPFRLGGSWSDLFAITLYRPLRNLSATTSSCIGSSSCRQPRLGRPADEVRLVRPVMGRQCPDHARHLVGQRHHGDVPWPPFGQAQRPVRRRLGVGQHRPGTVDQHRAQIPVAAFGDAEYVHPPAGPGVSGHQPQPGGELAARPERARITPLQPPRPSHSARRRRGSPRCAGSRHCPGATV